MEIIFAAIIAPIILFFILPFFNKPRDKFIAWVQAKISKKPTERISIVSDPQIGPELIQLAQQKYNREREKIDPELNKNIRIAIEEFSRNGILHSGMFFTKVVELHTDRLFKLLEARKNINQEVLLQNKQIKSDKDIEVAMQDLERIAEAQKSAIFGCEHIFNQNEKNSFVQEMSKNIARILSNIRRDLNIEKNENLLLRK